MVDRVTLANALDSGASGNPAHWDDAVIRAAARKWLGLLPDENGHNPELIARIVRKTARPGRVIAESTIAAVLSAITEDTPNGT